MRKDDGTLNVRGEVTPLMQLLIRRRSCRKYASGSATADDVAGVLGCARRFAERCGFDAPRLLVVSGAERDDVAAAAMKGVIGKVNPWLAFTRAQHVLLCGAVCPPSATARERAIKQASMTMQVAILAATELGLGTCWMAGINHERVEHLRTLPDGAALIAISPLGLPPPRMGISWDTLLHHAVSKRRKPLEVLWMAETWRAS
jgi:nitroreductase